MLDRNIKKRKFIRFLFVNLRDSFRKLENGSLMSQQARRIPLQTIIKRFLVILVELLVRFLYYVFPFLLDFFFSVTQKKLCKGKTFDVTHSTPQR